MLEPREYEGDHVMLLCIPCWRNVTPGFRSQRLVYTNAIMYIAEETTLTAHLETASRLSRGGATMEDDAPDDLVSEDNV